jgi:thiol-disulfide isomerase/thioredoxin
VNYKDQAKKIIFEAIASLPRVAAALVLIALLQVTGLLSALSDASQSALLQTGVLDADDEVLPNGENFDYRFTIKDLEGNRIAFEQYKGKVVFLNIWATWCGPCRAEMAGIQKLFSRIEKDRVAFVMLSIDKDSDHDKVVSYLKNKDFTFPAFQPSGYLTEQLNVPAIPTTFIVSKEGKIVRKEVGNKRYNTSRFQNFLEDLSK